MSEARPRTILIACGALAREALAVLEANRLEHVELTCVSALLHNRPQKIPAAVREKICSRTFVSPPSTTPSPSIRMPWRRMRSTGSRWPATRSRLLS